MGSSSSKGSFISSEILQRYHLLSKKISFVNFFLVVLGSWTLYKCVQVYLSPLRKIPGPPYNPLFGNVREAMLGEAMDTSVKWVKKYGGIVHFYHLLGRDRVLVASPEGLKHVLVTNEHNYLRNNIPNDSEITPINKSVVGVIGQEHAAQRRLLNPLFTKAAIRGYLDIFQQTLNEIIESWQGKTTSDAASLIEIHQDLSRMSLDVFGKAVLGIEIDSRNEPDNEMAWAFRTFTNVDSVSFTADFPILRWLPLSSNRQFKEKDKASRKVLQLMEDLIDKPDETESDETTLTLLQRLKLARNAERFTRDEMVGQLIALITAGHDTTSWTLSWILLTLAQHPEIQEKVREEVLQVMPSSGLATLEHLDKMPYLYAVIKECQRLYPAAPNFIRRSINDDKIGPYFIPAGTTVIIHFGALMRNDAVWPEADQFKPERFLSDKSHDMYRYLPFSTGPHTCLGIQFARAQLRIVLARLLQHFRFSKPDDVHFKRKLKGTLKSDPPVRLLVQSLDA